MRFAVAFAIGSLLALGACQQGPLPNLAPGATAFIVPPPAPPPPPPPPPVVTPTMVQEYGGLPQNTVVYHRSKKGALYVGRKACPAGQHFEGKRIRVAVSGGTQVRTGKGRCVWNKT